MIYPNLYVSGDILQEIPSLAQTIVIPDKQSKCKKAQSGDRDKSLSINSRPFSVVKDVERLLLSHFGTPLTLSRKLKRKFLINFTF